MMGLDEAKGIIHGADPDFDSEQYSEIEAAAVSETGWLHLGEDYYYREDREQVAGPGSGSSTRILADLRAKECGGRTDIEWPHDVCNGMGRGAWRQGIIGF